MKFLRKGIELISIIIPVFNNEKEDIYRCIKSTHSSLYPDVEIIIVDDGSDFDCANYLDIIGIQFDKIKVYHILNQGVSAARNIGIEKARGEYVCFLDADDFLTDNILGKVISYLTEPNKLLITNYNYIINDLIQILIKFLK